MFGITPYLERTIERPTVRFKAYVFSIFFNFVRMIKRKFIKRVTIYPFQKYGEPDAERQERNKEFSSIFSHRKSSSRSVFQSPDMFARGFSVVKKISIES